MFGLFDPVGNPFSPQCYTCQKTAGLIADFETCSGLDVNETENDEGDDSCLYFPNAGDADTNGTDDACESPVAMAR